MKRPLRALAIIVAALASAIPVFVMATFTFNTIGAFVSTPQQRLIGWTLAFVIWWVGFGAALVFARRLSRSQKPWLEMRVIVPLIAGLISVALLEVQSWHSRQHGLMLGFFAVPFVLPIAAGWLVRMLSNRPVNPDARDVPPSAEDINARAGYRER
jgi:glucan phosphoethanolaminetransferase (alkaline phosphatase superfamily)